MCMHKIMLRVYSTSAPIEVQLLLIHLVVPNGTSVKLQSFFFVSKYPGIMLTFFCLGEYDSDDTLLYSNHTCSKTVRSIVSTISIALFAKYGIP